MKQREETRLPIADSKNEDHDNWRSHEKTAMKFLKRMPAMFWIYSTLVALFGYWQYRYYGYLSWDLITGIGLFCLAGIIYYYPRNR